MKKKLIISIIVLLIISLTLFIFLKKETKFYLETKYYGKEELFEIDVDKLENLIKEKESFSLLIYQPLCITSTSFEEVVSIFQEKNLVSFYKISFSLIKELDNFPYIKHYPSFAIFEKGKIIAFLDAENDKDIDSYKNVEGFKKWFTSYVKLKNNDNDKKINSSNKEQTVKEVRLDNVKREKEKINIYFFWQKGCIYCAKEINFFKSIEKENGQLYNLHSFDVSENKDNINILKSFSKAMNENIKTVPYTIIGKQSFNGFNEEISLKIIKIIKEEYKESYDIYFDKIIK